MITIFDFIGGVLLSVMWFMVVTSLSTIIYGNRPTDKQVLIISVFAGPFVWVIFAFCFAYEYSVKIISR
ncbi:MAG: hypothetical protein ACKVJK_20625 [Methylophagaceae bacterium]|tara:strand:- start:1959 stop:2165 length:207 start_codon:yes stop_codon:yes gene_type:complete